MLETLPPINRATYLALEKLACQDKLATFSQAAWRLVDPATYSHNWHIDAICEHLEAVSHGDIRHLLINIPPRHMKSRLVNVMWRAWTWAQDPVFLEDGTQSPVIGPSTKFLSASYQSDLTIRDNEAMRQLIKSPWYQQHWPTLIKATEDGKQRFVNTVGGQCIATSVSGLATGEGGDIIIIDDPHNVTDVESDTVREGTLRWFTEVLPTRLNDQKRGAFVIVMQRVHERDVSALAKDMGYTHLCIPARYESDHPNLYVYDKRKRDGQPLWEERFGEKELAQLEMSMGAYAVAGQLQQRPVPRGGGMFKQSWFDIVEALPADRVKVRAWDLAATEAGMALDPDYTVGVLMSRDKTGFFYIEDVVRIRGSAHEVERLIKNTALLDGKHVRIRIPQDPGQAGKAQAAYLVRQLAGYTVKAVSPSGAKETRAAPFAAQAEAGNVKLLQAPWNRQFLDELCVFPAGAHDDVVDAASDAFAELVEPERKALIRDMKWHEKPGDPYWKR